jgi:thiol-disulfide isomerase/thioredoxin
LKKIFPVIIFMSLFLIGLVAQMMLSGIETKADRVAEQKKTESLIEKTFRTSEFITTKGNKYNYKTVKEDVVLLNFWASWCFPCMKEFETLTKFVNKYSGKVKVIGINNDTEDDTGTPVQKISKVEKKKKLNFESVFDKASAITTKFNLSVIPATYVFYKGKYVYHTNEEVDFTSKKFTEIIDDLLEK